jgi:hypothetical protein
MARAAFQKTSFNGGELSPLLDGRADLGKYANGCTILENYIPTVQGPVYRRPGTRFVDDLGASDPVLVPFIYNREQAYMLAIGSVIRLYTGEGIVESSPGVPYTFGAGVWSAPPRRADGRSRLSYTQSGDVLFVCDAEGGKPLMQIKRLGALSWTVEDVVFSPPPVGDIVRQGLSYDSGAVISLVDTFPFGALTAPPAGEYYADSLGLLSASTRGVVFVELVGSPFYFPEWSAGLAVDPNRIIQYQGRFYYYNGFSAGTLGSTPPTHTFGDGPGGNFNLTYCGTGRFYFQILNFLDSGGAGAVFHLRRVPSFSGDNTAINFFNAPDASSTSFNMSRILGLGTVAMRDGDNVGTFPDNAALFRERLALSVQRRLHLSTAGDFPSFRPTDASGMIAADSAMDLELLSGDLSPVSWMAPAERLLIASTGGERLLGEQNTSNAFGPTNVRVDVSGAAGSVDVGPARVGNDILFLDRTGRRIYRSTLGEGGQAFQNLSALADHIGLASPFVAMAWREIPTPVLFLASQAGELVGVTFDASQEVVAWNRHVLGGGGLVRDLGCIPSADGTRDNLWLLVERTVLGVQRFYLEVMPDEYRMGMPIEEARFLDCSLVYDGVPANVISGLDHLEGETVQAVGDGFALGEFTVSVGSITLPQEYSKISVGLHAPSRLRTMRVHLGADDGVAMGKKIRIHKAAVRLVDTVNIQTGWAFDKLVRQDFREPGMAMDTAIPGQTVERTMSFPGTYDGDGYVCIQQDLPLPCTIVALAIEFEVNS